MTPQPVGKDPIYLVHKSLVFVLGPFLEHGFDGGLGTVCVPRCWDTAMMTGRHVSPLFVPQHTIPHGVRNHARPRQKRDCIVIFMAWSFCRKKVPDA